MNKPHDVVLDPATNGAERFTCRTEGCLGATALRQPYMSDMVWYEAKKHFFRKHPGAAPRKLTAEG